MRDSAGLRVRDGVAVVHAGHPNRPQSRGGYLVGLGVKDGVAVRDAVALGVAVRVRVRVAVRLRVRLRVRVRLGVRVRVPVTDRLADAVAVLVVVLDG